MKRSVLIGVASAAALSTLALRKPTPRQLPREPPAKRCRKARRLRRRVFRQDVLSSLSKAGFTDVSVKADSFVGASQG